MKRLFCLAVLLITPLGAAMVGCGGGPEYAEEGEGADTLDADAMMDAAATPASPDAAPASP